MRCTSEVSTMHNEVRDNLAMAMDFDLPVSQRVMAAERLGELGDPSVVIPLGVLFGQTDAALRDALSMALKRLSAIEIIARDLQSQLAPRRIRATQLLALIGDDAALPALIAALDDPCAKVRENAAGALCAFKDPSTIEPLAEMLFYDAEADVRAAAAQALGELPPLPALEALERAAKTERDPFTRVLIERSVLRWRAQSSVADLRL